MTEVNQEPEIIQDVDPVTKLHSTVWITMTNAAEILLVCTEKPSDTLINKCYEEYLDKESLRVEDTLINTHTAEYPVVMLDVTDKYNG